MRTISAFSWLSKLLKNLFTQRAAPEAALNFVGRLLRNTWLLIDFCLSVAVMFVGICLAIGGIVALLVLLWQEVRWLFWMSGGGIMLASLAMFTVRDMDNHESLPWSQV